MRLQKVKIISGLVLLFWFNHGLTNEAGNKITNMMKGHGSPYSELHQNDPVAWQEWGPKVVERAKAENKMPFSAKYLKLM